MGAGTMLRRGAVVLVIAAMALIGSGVAQAAVVSHISAAYTASTGMFHGTVTSSNSECVAHRTVRLFKETSSGNQLLGKTTSGTKGGWHIALMHAKGKYFAKVPTQMEMGITCSGARSAVVDVM